MRLYLIRHGIAIDRDDPKSPPEAERFLTEEGIARTRKAMEGLARVGVKLDAVWSSPYVRALQTAEIAADALDFDRKRIHKTKALLPEAPPADLLRELSDLEGEEAACCGHAPHVDEFLAHALGGKHGFTQMKKAGVACLELERVKAGDAILLWLMTPGQLRGFTK